MLTAAYHLLELSVVFSGLWFFMGVVPAFLYWIGEL